MTRTLLVFDLDGTLLNTRAGRTAFNRAFEQVCGLAAAAASVEMAGRTDPWIFQAVCEHHGLQEHAFDDWKAVFLAELETAVREDPGQVLPGVSDLLERLQGEQGYVMALGTGNVEEGARLKLEPHGLNRYFAVGGFGADGPTRKDLIAAAIARAEARHGVPFRQRVVIGDTPHDIACGRAHGCKTVAVATGPYSLEALAQHQPDLLLPNFTDMERFLEIVGNW